MKVNFSRRIDKIGTTMTVATQTSMKAALALGAVLALSLIASACATNDRAIPNWGGDTASVSNAPTTVYRPAAAAAEVPTALSSNGRFTFTQGCTGAFSVRDARTNRDISSGRAVNSGSGLIALDSQGRQTRAIATSTSLSVTFLPDCNCRANRDQSSSVAPNQRFAATAPSAATCAAS